MLKFCEKTVARATFAPILALALFACNSDTPPKQQTAQTAGPASQVESSMEYSKNLKLTAQFGEEIAEIRSIVGRDTLTRQFVLRKKGDNQKPIPQELKNATVLYVPLQKVVALSSAHIGYMVRLGVQDRIVAVGEGKYVYDSTLYARAQKGEIQEVGNGGEINFEKILALEPDLVMTFATGGAHDDYERLSALNIPLMLTSEWQEETPLAKAEWIKLYEKLFDAKPTFKQIKENYLKIRDDFKHEPDKCPRVLVGMSYSGVWYASGGNSFTAHLIKDAGGCYLWAADTSRELKFSLEEIMMIADSADVWINPGMFSTPEQLLAAEPRISHIRAFSEKRVYQNDKRVGPGGGNDFYESAVAYPAEVLQNLRSCIQNTTNGVDSTQSGFDWYHNIFIF